MMNGFFLHRRRFESFGPICLSLAEEDERNERLFRYFQRIVVAVFPYQSITSPVVDRSWLK